MAASECVRVFQTFTPALITERLTDIIIIIIIIIYNLIYVALSY